MDELLYHRMARTERYRWWRPIVELVLFGALVIGIWLGFVPVLDAVAGPALDGAPGIIKLGLTLAVLMPAAMLAAKIMKRPAGALSSVENRIRWRWLFVCVGIAMVFTFASSLLGLLVPSSGPSRGGWVGFAEFAPLAAAVVLVIPFQAAAEEYAFRGVMLQTIGAWVRPPAVAIAISAVVFGLAHGLGIEGFLAITTFGTVAAILTVRTGGLEASIALHVINNVSLFLLDAATGRGDRWITELNAEVSWLAVAIDAGTNIAYCVIVLRVWSRRATSSATPDSDR